MLQHFSIFSSVPGKQLKECSGLEAVKKAVHKESISQGKPGFVKTSRLCLSLSTSLYLPHSLQISLEADSAAFTLCTLNVYGLIIEQGMVNLAIYIGK